MPEPIAVLTRVAKIVPQERGFFVQLEAISTSSDPQPTPLCTVELVVAACGKDEDLEAAGFVVGRIVAVAFTPVAPREITLTPDTVSSGAVGKGLTE